MKTKNFRGVLLLFSLFVVLALIGGSWTTSLAQGTVPPVPPAGPFVPIIPVTGGCPGPHLEDVGGACVPDGAIEIVQSAQAAVEIEVPAKPDITTYSEVMRIYVQEGQQQILDYGFDKKVTVYFELTPELLEAFKRDGSIHILWYNPIVGKWVKLPTTLDQDNSRLTAQVYKCGLFVVGSLLNY